MFKRMSVLVRRDGDTREQFSRGWLNHGQFITGLPGLRGYVQNHVVEDFGTADARFLAADGFVELRFDSPEAMAAAFASPAARAMAQDEPNFLGHGSGYAFAADTGLGDAEAGNKLMIALGDCHAKALRDAAIGMATVRVIEDDVIELIAKPGMAPPQPVGRFLHLYCPNAEAAQAIGIALADLAAQAGLQAAIFRVRTVRFA